MRSPWRLTPQFSGRMLPSEARRERIMKWRARGVAAMPFDGPLQLLVRRHADEAHVRRLVMPRTRSGVRAAEQMKPPWTRHEQEAGA
jgi:hypothetical protein